MVPGRRSFRKSINPGPANAKPTPQLKNRDSFSFGYSYNEEHEHGAEAGPNAHDDKNEACREQGSDSELERERVMMLPTRCKTNRRAEHEEYDGSTQFREAPDFESLETYDDYLDHYVSWKDLMYFESDEIARIIIKLGFRLRL